MEGVSAHLGFNGALAVWSDAVVEPGELPDAASRVLIIGWFAFPFGSASASRVRHIAQGLGHNGIATHVLTTRRVSWREGDVCGDGGLAYEGTTYETTNAFETSQRKSIVRRALDLLEATRKSHRRAEELVRSGAVDAVLLYSRSFFMCQPIIRMCRRYKVPVLVDVVEGFLPWSIPYFVRTVDCYLGTRISHRMCDGAIVISSFLDRKLTDLGVPTLLVPSLIDSGKAQRSGTSLDPPQKEVVNLVYVGQFKPDEAIDDLLDGVRLARERGCPVELQVVGNDGRSRDGRPVSKRIAAQPALKDHVHFLGWLSAEEYDRILNGADALMLLRRNTDRALAAFPTRLPEFLATGKPVITNDVPDVPYYLRDRVHAHVVAIGRPDLVAERIEEIFRDPATQAAIGEAGSRRTKECFDYRDHGARIGTFIQKMIAPA